MILVFNKPQAGFNKSPIAASPRRLVSHRYDHFRGNSDRSGYFGLSSVQVGKQKVMVPVDEMHYQEVMADYAAELRKSSNTLKIMDRLNDSCIMKA